MLARLLAGYRFPKARLCAGTEFVKGEWRRVPDGLEQEAQNSGILEFEPENSSSHDEKVMVYATEPDERPAEMVMPLVTMNVPTPQTRIEIEEGVVELVTDEETPAPAAPAPVEVKPNRKRHNRSAHDEAPRSGETGSE